MWKYSKSSLDPHYYAEQPSKLYLVLQHGNKNFTYTCLAVCLSELNSQPAITYQRTEQQKSCWVQGRNRAVRVKGQLEN
jgi:hypothetical protein